MIHIITAVHSRRSHNKVGIYILIMQALPSKVTLLFLTLRLLESPISSTGTILVTIKRWLGIFQLGNKQILTEFLLARSECSGGLFEKPAMSCLKLLPDKHDPEYRIPIPIPIPMMRLMIPRGASVVSMPAKRPIFHGHSQVPKATTLREILIVGPLFPQCFLTSFVGHDFMYVYRCVRTSKEFP